MKICAKKKNIIKEEDVFVQTLINAAKNQNLQAYVNGMIKHNCNVHTPNSKGYSAIRILGFQGNINAALWLIDQGANILDCLEGALSGGQTTFVKSMIELMKNKYIPVNYEEMANIAQRYGQDTLAHEIRIMHLKMNIIYANPSPIFQLPAVRQVPIYLPQYAMQYGPSQMAQPYVMQQQVMPSSQCSFQK